MTTVPYAVIDSATMLRRTLRHALRYPSMTIAGVATPVVLLLLFVGVLGGTLGAGLSPGSPGSPGAGSAGGGKYIDYVAPGIILIAVASGCLSTSVAVCVDLTEGIVNRFRTMAISRSALLTGHVLGSVIQTMISTGLVIAVAVLMGFRPTAGVRQWLGVIAVLLLLTFALTWLAVLIGLTSKTPESASNTPLLIQFLPFLGSAFVPTDSLPAGVRWFAEYQPFTPVIETLRGLLTGGPTGNNPVIAIAWCVGLTAFGYVGSRVAVNRDRVL